ncbi:FlgB family protein [Albimonas pacifica]|uniref:Flagellar basal body rod protein FlgB n=1 Tax=Albimonas pacifica TaxID=1114924 RepID=A0A1I3DZM0_9RHOB|nr:FlgB family protein [Albimonas pacifica]SFH92190.1 flagellar basal-body rod protein FlgB [Albimonas pacifica]
MSEGLTILSLTEALADHAAGRQALIARNVAHADTPGYRAADLTPFSDSYAARAALDDAGAFRPAATRAGHLSGTGDAASGAEVRAAHLPAAASPNGNTVALEDQMVRAAEAKLQHEMALGVWRKSLDILRVALERPR